ncbi:MAG: ATP-binding protein [Planctomycetota bacterium]
MNRETARILVVDDEPGIRQGCEKILLAEGYEVAVAADGQAAMELLTRDPAFALALVDLKMPRMDGIELIRRIGQIDPDIVSVVITAYASIDTAVEATRQGAYRYIPKPFTPDELLMTVRNGLERRALSIEARLLRQERERRLLEVAFERSKCNTVINCMTDGVIVINSEQRVVLKNSAAVRINSAWGYINLPAALSAFACDDLAAIVAEVFVPGCDSVILSREVKIGGSVYMVNAGPVREPAEELLGAVVVFRDITALKKLEHAKSLFVSMVAHEVKGPVGVIEGFLDVILEGAAGDDPERIRNMLGRALLRARALREMVGELMNLSAMETGHFALKRSPTVISTVAAEAVEACREKAAAKHITLSFAARGSAGTQKGWADVGALRSVFTNIIDNAVKYTPDGGGVTVTVDHDGVYLHVIVNDTGFGIAPEDLPRIFEEFFRVRDKHTAAIPGTGLGLHLARKLVEMHNGTISVRSTPGAGSVFTIAIPIMAGD